VKTPSVFRSGDQAIIGSCHGGLVHLAALFSAAHARIQISLPQRGAVSLFVRPPVRAAALSSGGDNNLMTQRELNHAISKQTGDSVTEIARHGFSLMSEEADESSEPDDSDDLLLLITATEEEESFQCSVFSVQ
jgi:hypothetical protein